jgi:hypothetical protein
MANEEKFGQGAAGEHHPHIAPVDPREHELIGGDDTIHGGIRTKDKRFRRVQEGDTHALRLAAEAINQRYVALGRASSPLGLSVSTELHEEADGTLRRDFRGGHITFSPDTGDVAAVVTSVAQVYYKGLKCFGRQGGFRKDKPYVVMSIVQPDPFVDGDEIKVTSYRAPAADTYRDVDDGDTRTDGIRQFFADAPGDLIIHSVVMEHDEGDPEKVKDAVKKALQQAADAGAAAISGGVATSVPLDPDTLQGMAVDWLADKFTDLLGAGDDSLGDGSFVIPYSTWSTGQFPPMMTRDGITYNYKQYCTDGDASYDVMYEVKVAHMTRTV